MSPTEGIRITLLDGEHIVRFPNSALLRLERELGGWSDFGRLPLESTFTALWAGLLHEDPTRTLDTVCDLVDIRDIAHIGQVVTEAIAAAMPAPTEEPKRGKATAKAAPKTKRALG